MLCGGSNELTTAERRPRKAAKRLRWHPRSIDQVQFLARLEAHGFARGDRHLCSGSRIAPDAGLARPHIEHPEAAQFDPLTLRQGLLQALEDGIHRCLSLVAREAGSFDDAMHDVLLDQGMLQKVELHLLLRLTSGLGRPPLSIVTIDIAL